MGLEAVFDAVLAFLAELFELIVAFVAALSEYDTDPEA